MGTNYRRIPKVSDMIKRQQNLTKRLEYDIDLYSHTEASQEFNVLGDGWDTVSPWSEFTYGMSVHLGKRSSGWKFLWNWNDGEYYTNKNELMSFIRSGRIVDEYGDLIDTEEFITMSLEWGQPDGLSVNEEYYKSKEQDSFFNDPKHYDTIIDGLCVSSSKEFS